MRDKAVEAVRKLLKGGASGAPPPVLPHYTDSAGMTPLHLAAIFNEAEICAALIDAGASCEALNRQGVAREMGGAWEPERKATRAITFVPLSPHPNPGPIRRDADRLRVGRACGQNAGGAGGQGGSRVVKTAEAGVEPRGSLLFAGGHAGLCPGGASGSNLLLGFFRLGSRLAPPSSFRGAPSPRKARVRAGAVSPLAGPAPLPSQPPGGRPHTPPPPPLALSHPRRWPPSAARARPATSSA